MKKKLIAILATSFLVWGVASTASASTAPQNAELPDIHVIELPDIH
ncbi:hypothetical protein [Rossellomorea vietnamensis]